MAELGITTLAELRAAAEANRLRDLDGLGPKSEEKILAALARPMPAQASRRTILGSVLPQLRALAATLAEHPAAVEVSIAGSARRYRETVRDLDLIATATDSAALIEAFCSLPNVLEIVARGETKATIVAQDGLRFDLRVVPPEAYGNLLQHFTGSKDHNVALREEAVRRGLSVSEYGITEVESGVVHAFASEEEVYRFLGYGWIPPELREDRASSRRRGPARCPSWSSSATLRGDLHTHTTWSDGKDSLEAMVAEAIARATGTTRSATTPTGCGRGGWSCKRPRSTGSSAALPIRLLKGIEVNIKADGSLDVPDEELARLDWVVASLHAGSTTSRPPGCSQRWKTPTSTASAIRRGARSDAVPGSALDFERVVAKALETGTFLEINSQPDRLDLSDVHARAVAEAGLRVVVDSDAHQTSALDYVELGVGQARRAWLGPAQVVNTRSWDESPRCESSAPRELPRRPRGRLRLGGDLRRDRRRTARRRRGEPGRYRRGASAGAADHPEPFSDVLGDLDRLIVPGLTHWNHPRFFAYFANTGSEPGILAELITAALNVNAMSGSPRLRRPNSSRWCSTGWPSCSACRPGCTAISRTPLRPPRSRRSREPGAAAGRHDRRLRAGPLLGREGGGDPRARGRSRAGRRRVPHAPRCGSLGRDRAGRDGGYDLVDLRRPGARAGPPLRGGWRLASRRRRLRRRRRRLPESAGAWPAWSRPTRSS